MELNEKEKKKLLFSLMSLLEKGQRFNLTSTAIPNELYDDVRIWVNEATRILTPYNSGRCGLNLNILKSNNLSCGGNIGETFTVLFEVVHNCVARIKNGSLDSWFYHLTPEDIVRCANFL